ncbi:MAG: hypothetical protein QXG65_04500 [Thermoplasmata archaeon]
MADDGRERIREASPAVARVLEALVAEAEIRRSRSGGRPMGPVRFLQSELRARLLRERVFEDPTLLLTRLRRRGLLHELPEGRSDRAYLVPYPEHLKETLAPDRPPEVTHEPVTMPDEGRALREMDDEFVRHLATVLSTRLEETLRFGRSLGVRELFAYLEGLFGPTLALDPMIALLQQYALADVPLLAPTGRPTGSSGFHLALFGPPGTGKTFAIDDLVRGNPRQGVPPHGLPGRNRYCGGITPAQFLRVGAYYEGRTFNFIVPEFNDWFRYRGMVEPLKLVMEQRPVRWETTFGSVGPYTFRSFFSVNYNVRTSGVSDYWTTVSDPNFAALEDRMLLRFHPMTKERFRAVERSAERLELGEIDFAWADRIRDHLTLVHAIQTRHPMVAGRWPHRPVRLGPAIYTALREVSERALEETDAPSFSPRLKSRAVRLASAAAIVGMLRDPTAREIPIGTEEIDFARRFYTEEIAARAGRRGATDGR